MRRAAAIAGAAVLASVVCADAAASLGDYKTSARLRALARLEAEVDFVVAQRWSRGLAVGRWQGRPFVVVARDARLAELRAVAPELVVQRKRHVWELRAPLFVVGHATLTIAAPAVRQLRLVDLGANYATIVTYFASLRVRGLPGQRVWIRSWVPALRRPDVSLDDGRGAVSVRGSGRLDASYATFADLGFTFGLESGVALNGLRPETKGTGMVDHSTFTRNVFGAYTSEAKFMRFSHDAFTHNLVYGLDPHDHSNWFLVDHNVAAFNGRHGIILSRFCLHDVVRHNVSERNGWNGIVIDDGRRGRIGASGFDHVYDNVVRDNGRVGISIDGSNENIVANNAVSGGLTGIRVFGRATASAAGNELAGNTVSGARSAGILVARPGSGTIVSANRVAASLVGIAVHGAHGTLIARSRIVRARLHGISLVGSVDTRIVGNRVSGAGPSPLYRAGAVGTLATGNVDAWNYPLPHDLARVMSEFVGPGLWALLLAAAVAGGVVRARFARAHRASAQPEADRGTTSA